MCNCKLVTVMMPENEPKQEKGADPRILLYMGSDKEKFLKQNNNRTVVKKINTYHYIAFYMQKQKKGRKRERADLQPEDDNPNPTLSLG